MGIIIRNILPRLILDSRGYPTIEAEIVLSDKTTGRACVPSGASTGENEALELRDKEEAWSGKGVQQAIHNIEKKIKPALLGMSPFKILEIDMKMINLDGTTNKSKLGANAILAVSLANIRAGAQHKKQHLYQYIFEYLKNNYSFNSLSSIPKPMMNILNGGSHADNNIDIQEFMIIPSGLDNYLDELQAGTEIFHSLKAILKKQNHHTAVGDEGGFAPSLSSNKEAIELILQAIEKTQYTAGKEISLALDVAASEIYNQNLKKYIFKSENKVFSASELIEYYKNICGQYPIISIEDGLDQNDWEAWTRLNKNLGNKIQIIGDDLTVTNTKILQKAIHKKAINAILIKPNQIGTFSETIDAIKLAKENNLKVIISHRSGETEDTFIADLAVATGADQIKTGSLCRSDRTSKYNQLLRIKQNLNKGT